jgi:hypothetical protein
MIDNKPFIKATSPGKDRRNDVHDIEGATTFNKQLQASKPLNTNYDKLETFQNKRKSFMQRRNNAVNRDSKRSMRTDDIKGAIPVKGKSITESRRIKLTSPDLSDLISDIENYRKRMLNKNGYIELAARNKPEGSRKEQSFNVFNNEFETNPIKNIKETATPRISDRTDAIGPGRFNSQFKSQPRYGAHNKIQIIKSIID